MSESIGKLKTNAYFMKDETLYLLTHATEKRGDLSFVLAVNLTNGILTEFPVGESVYPVEVRLEVL